MYARRKKDAYRRWHAQIATDGGLVTEGTVARLSSGKAGESSNDSEVIAWLAGRLELPWRDFETAVQRAFNCSGGDASVFAEELLELEWRRLAGQDAFRFIDDSSAHRDEVDVQRMDIHLAELVAAWAQYNSAVSEVEKREAARWVKECLNRAASDWILDEFREAFEWLVAESNSAKRGRKASALGCKLYGYSLFRDISGGTCRTLSDVAASQSVSEDTLRAKQREIPGLPE